ncbi:MAG: hypothetical protein Q7R92_00570 [bacterium]|nr:hypothetical protein [bacterium]
MMFEEFNFSARQINNYFNAASRDFKIAADAAVPEVIFKFSYDALIKLAITVCAKNGLRIKARAGHHIELLKKLSEIIGDSEVETVGNIMRGKRNYDLYGGGVLISEKEAEGYRDWLKNIFIKAEDYLDENLRLF